ASANPEDYTNRGRIITPLKDRFGSQIRTHYPLETALEVEIVEAERRPPETDGRPVHVPAFLKELVAEISQLARQNPNVNQRSGVSVRMTICNTETLVAAAVRRSLRNGEEEVVPRLSDLDALVTSTAGKVEIESIDEGREGEVLGRIFSKAILQVYRDNVKAEDVRPLLAAFDDGLSVEVDAETPARDVLRQIDGLDDLTHALVRIGGESPGGVVGALELVLEGLHLSKRLNKDEVDGRVAYSAR
ncbi:MAG: magnesium chelatase, partial [Acidimicrobiia bacterium]|nr:magnesium chelatase [Acidimicrobiia bacterium]